MSTIIICISKIDIKIDEIKMKISIFHFILLGFFFVLFRILQFSWCFKVINQKLIANKQKIKYQSFNIICKEFFFSNI